jgi:hypothetical protein
MRFTARLGENRRLFCTADPVEVSSDGFSVSLICGDGASFSLTSAGAGALFRQ